MSFLSKLFSKKPAYVHPVFGKMSFVKIGAGKSYWEGRTFFPPTKSIIVVLVDGEESGVAIGADAFFEQVKDRYRSLVARHGPEMDRKLGSISQAKIPPDFDAAYRLSSVSIPDTRLRNEWDLGFDCLFDRTFYVSLEFDGWDHAEIVVDS